MTWDEFRVITFEIKNNVSDKNYDIAKGVVYLHGGIKEFLRISKPKATIELLMQIQQKYIDKLERYNKNTVSIYLNSHSKVLRTSHNNTSDFNSWLGI